MSARHRNNTAINKQPAARTGTRSGPGPRMPLIALLTGIGVLGGCVLSPTGTITTGPDKATTGAEMAVILPATTRRIVQPRGLAPGAEHREVTLVQERPIPFSRMVAIIADVIGHPVIVEERPARTRAIFAASARDDAPAIVGVPAVADSPASGETNDVVRSVTLPPAPLLTLDFRGSVRDLLNTVGQAAGYEWTWRTGTPARPGTPAQIEPPEAPHPEAYVFWRYHDTGWTVADPPDTIALWTADPDRHQTLKGVLADWSRRAGWTLVWDTDTDSAVTARAAFEGTFEQAVDALLADTRAWHPLIPTAYRANRHLRITGPDTAAGTTAPHRQSTARIVADIPGTGPTRKPGA